MADLPILKVGCCWRVRDGTSIKILTDKWIPKHPANRVIYPSIVDVGEWFMADLIEPGLNCWYHDYLS